MPPPRLERGSLPPEGNALSTELWGYTEILPSFMPTTNGKSGKALRDILRSAHDN